MRVRAAMDEAIKASGIRFYIEQHLDGTWGATVALGEAVKADEFEQIHIVQHGATPLEACEKLQAEFDELHEETWTST